MNNQTNQLSNPVPAPTQQASQRASKAGMTLRAKLTFAFIIVALIPLSLMAYWKYYVTRKAILDTANQTLQLKATEAAADLDAFIQSNLEAITAEGQLPQLQNYMQLPVAQRAGSAAESELQETFQVLANSRGEGQVLSYGLLNAGGVNLLDTNETNIGESESHHAYFKDALRTTQPVVEVVLLGSLQKEPVLHFSSRVRDARGVTLGVVRVGYRADVLQSFFRQTGRPTTGGTFGMLLDDHQMFLAHGEQPELIAQNAAIPGIAENLRGILLNPLFTLQYGPTADETGWAAAANLKTQPWSVIFVQPQTEILNEIRAEILITALIGGIGILLLLFVANNTADLLVTPLRRLVGVSQQVAAGAFSLRIPVTSRDEVGRLAEAFNRVASQLQEAIDRTEQHTTERTRALESMVRSLEKGNQITRQINTILDLDELFRYIVDRLQKEFQFYYTQIYLVEKETGELVLAEGSGEIGRQLKEKNYRLKAGQGIVGTVAATNEYFMSNRVSDSKNFVPNPLLPRTKSELAVPLRIGTRVLGVLDLQSDQVDRFAPEDVPLLQSIAGQAAIVLENARLLAETQEVLKQVESLNRRLTGEGWKEFTEDVPISGYHFKTRPGYFLGPSSSAWLPPMEHAVREKQLVSHHTPGNGHGPKSELAVPLLLRGEVIGVLGVKREEAHEWNEEEVSAVETVAGQVALALENARLSKEQEKTIVQLKDVDRLKSEFLTSMSHELRTPLNSIIGFADVLLQGIDGDLTDHAMTDVQAIYNSGQHLLALINDILDLAKIEAGRMELVREAVSIDDIVKSVLSSASSLLKNKSVQVLVEKEETLPSIYADRLRLSQVLLNLVSNAIKFTDEGAITIKAEVKAEEPDKMLISVRDTGIGIPTHMLDTVFERFRQVDSSSSRKAGGTGLGLAICRQLVEMHGGQIGVTSEINKGSTFYFTVPLAGTIV